MVQPCLGILHDEGDGLGARYRCKSAPALHPAIVRPLRRRRVSAFFVAHQWPNRISAQVTEIHNYRVLMYVCMCVAPINSSGAFSLSNNGERNNIKIKC